MAIAGLLVHTLKDHVKDVEKAVAEMEEMTTYGIHEDQYVVVVVEAPSDKMEQAVDGLDGLEGVLTVYTTYLTVEDEMDEDGNLESNISVKDYFKKKPKSPLN